MTTFQVFGYIKSCMMKSDPIDWNLLIVYQIDIIRIFVVRFCL